MLKLAANLDWLFTDLPIAARFSAAQAAGFRGVEGLFLWQHPLEHLRAAQRETSLPVVLMNAPAGNWAQGERGSLHCLVETRISSQPERGARLRHSTGLSPGSRYVRLAL